MMKLCFVALVLVVSPLLCFSDDSVPSKATLYSTSDGKGTTTGACGYGEFGRDMNNAQVAAVSRLWRNGTGCGACYQVRCTNQEYCNTNGVTVAVSDNGGGGGIDFIINRGAFAKMARPGEEDRLISVGVVDILYQRVPCRYPGNVLIKIHENSRFPDYFSILLLNVAGVNDVVAIEIKGAQGDWIQMRHVFGAVYDQSNPPRGPLSVRVRVRGSAGDTWKQGTNVIPSQWRPGAIYDSTFQLN